MTPTVTHVKFVIEGAGCESCATRVREALAPIVTVHDVAINDMADIATVSVSAPSIAESDVTEVLLAASVGSGHEYRVRSGSWASVVSRLHPAGH